jgi:NAD(P)-dependent dehydrogenase (short-subunit alcohol dehydrogenase family)
LEGRVVLVTGARQGIGQAIAIAAARAGARLGITSRKEGAASGTAAKIREFGSPAVELTVEVTSSADCRSAVTAMIAAYGSLDVVVNNAGVAVRGPSIDYPEAAWKDVMATNLTGSFLMSQAAASAMLSSGGGRIINLSSTFARRPIPERAAYSAAKAGLEQLTRVLAVEWAPLGITVNAISLTTILTESRVGLFSDPEVLQRRVAEIPLGRLGEVEDAVAAALFLAGPAGAFMTGQTMVVDGGFTLL